MKKQILFFVLILLFSSTLLADVDTLDSLAIIDPLEGFPALIEPEILDTMAISFHVYDEVGDFVTGLTIDVFEVKFGDEYCEKVSLTEAANVYTLELKPPEHDEEGLYNITLTYDDGSKLSVSTVLAYGALYTYSPLIENGLLWLKYYHNTDGSWNYYYQSHNLGITSLCLQAFLGRGYDVNNPLHGQVVEDAINFILDHQQSDGAFYTYSSMYENCMAVVALTSALKTSLPADLDSLITNALPAALAYITGPHIPPKLIKNQCELRL